MTDLVEFLRARLDEREQCLRDDKANADKVLASGTCVVFLPDRVGSLSYEQELAEVTAKRRIIDTEPRTPIWVEYEYQIENPAHLYWSHVLRLLALPYADHPDYQKEWKS